MSVTTKIPIAVGICLLGSALTAPMASAEPGAGPVRAVPGLFDGQDARVQQRHAGRVRDAATVGTVVGHGNGFGEARSDAERLKWGPCGMAPELRDCGPA